MSRAVRALTVLALAAAGTGLTPLAGAAAPAPQAAPSVQTYEVQPRQATPEDRYALAGGCYAVQDRATGRWLARADGAFAATAATPAAAEPFHLQATDLGRYLLFGSAKDFLAADGDTVVAADEPSESADFTLDGTRAAGYTLAIGDRGVAVAQDGSLSMGSASPLAFSVRSGCAAWPEISTNVTGDVVGRGTSYEESRGYLDAHLHTMAFEFVGGRSRCGRPWHPYGVAHALVDCPDHEVADGRGALLEVALSGTDPVAGHDTVGWPTFGYWPAYSSLTHEQIYYKWLERTWRGGLRLMTTLLVENGALCNLWPLKKNSCNEMDAVRLQAERMREFVRYIDAQAGGPGEGWLQIVTDPQQARRVMNEGKLAVILGIEISQLFNCTSMLDVAGCTEESIDAQLEEVLALGVRQMEVTNKFDNALSGVTGDAGTQGLIVNNGNVLTTGRHWQMLTCEGPFEDVGPEHDHEHNVDRRQLNPHDQGAPEELGGQDSIFGGILEVVGATGASPVYGPGPHCNSRGLTPLGQHLIERMVEKGMMFDPDHMSASARSAAIGLLEKAGYDGVVSSHSWSDDTIYARIARMGGIVTPYPRSVDFFIREWRNVKAAAEASDQYWGIGYGADTNGFGTQAAPRGADAPNPMTYPFTAFGGVRVDKQVSGQRTYDLNVDGVAHYGMYVDWIEDLRRAAGPEVVADLERGPEAYLQAWERARGIAPRSCRTPAAVTTGMTKGMTPQQVLEAAGQPHVREGREFRYCVSGSDELLTAEFDAADRLVRVDGRAIGGVAAPVGTPVRPATGALPATGAPGLLALVAATAALSGLALRRRRSPAA